MDVRCFLVHVQYCRHEIVRPVGFPQPRHAVIAPLIKFALVFHSCHVIVRSAQHNADCLHLVLPYLALQPNRVKAVANGSRTIIHTIGKHYQLTIEMCPCGVYVLWHDGAFDVCRHSAVGSLCLFQMQYTISHDVIIL